MSGGPPPEFEENGPADAPVVLLVPPLGRGRGSWAAQVPALARHFRCLSFDPRGIGSTPAGPGPWTVETLCADAVAVLDAAGARQAHVVGWSLGAAAATRLALDHPGRVSSLALLTPWARTDPHLAAAFTLLRELAEHNRPAAGELATSWLILSRDAVNAAGEGLSTDADAVVSAPGHPAPPVLASYTGSGITVDVLDRLRTLTTPTLVVGGTEDRLIDAAHARELAGAVAGAALYVLDGPGASHALPVERADEVNSLLLAFLEQHRRPSR